MIKNPYFVIFLVLSLVVLAVAGPGAMLFLKSNSAPTGNFSGWMLVDAVMRLGEVYSWFALISTICMGLSGLQGPSKTFFFFLCCSFFFSFLMFVSSNERKEDEKIKQFAIANQAALDERKPVLINGVAVVGQSDARVWTRDFLIRSGTLNKHTDVDKVVARCQTTCAQLEVWHGDTLRIVALEPSGSLYR